jgi:hypothetical protein
MLLLALENQGFFVENLRKNPSDFDLNAEELRWRNTLLSLMGMAARKGEKQKCKYLFLLPCRWVIIPSLLP